MKNTPCLLIALLPMVLGLALSPTAAAADGHGAHAAPEPDQPAKAASVPASAAAKGKAEVDVDPLERVRARLADKLGAVKAPDSASPRELRVANKPAAPVAVPVAEHAATPVALPSPVHGGAPQPAYQVPPLPAHQAAPLAARAAVPTPVHLAALAAPSVAVPAPAPAHRGTAVPRHAGVEKAAHHDLHWDYSGEAGPQAWGGLKPEFGLCSSGKRQSPIDIRDGISVELEPVQFDYRASRFGVIDNGHTVQVNVAPGNFIQLAGRRWELVQFHFHRPSEERIEGRQFDMNVHLVHRDAEGRLAVVAVQLERGGAQQIVQTVWNNLPLEKGEEVPAPVVLDLNYLLPPDRRYYTYMGSLTTPPCSEGVTWVVMRQPVQVSQRQIDIFTHLYPMNARPVQQAAGRLIKQSE